VVRVPRRGRLASFDLLVCDQDALPLLAIELDDASHRRSDRRRADETKDRASRYAGLPLVRWNVRAMPNVEELRATLAERRGQREREAIRGSHRGALVEAVR
jgi:hypothetical protein